MAKANRKKEKILGHYECHNCNKLWKVPVCPECGRKIRGAYCKDMATITNCTSSLFGEDGDV